MKFNIFQDYNEKNFGLEKLRAKYPKEEDKEIYTRILGHVPSMESIKSKELRKWENVFHVVKLSD